MKRLPLLLPKLTIALILVSVSARLSFAEDLGGSVLRDYPVSLTIPEGRFEVSLDYLMANSTTDRLGLPSDNASGAGDLQGVRLLADYGLQRRTTLMSAWGYRDLEFGLDSLRILSADLSFKRNLILRGHGWVPKLALDVGIRFDQTAGGDEMLLDGDANDNWSGPLAIDDLQDFTPYARLTAGQIWGRLFPNLFLEYGHSVIDGRATRSVPDPANGFSDDLSRSEDYVKAGLSVWVKFPYKALLHLEYDYIKLFRDGSLDRVDDNQLIKADFNYYLTPTVVFNIGGGWSQHRFNGQIPFLYNEFSQPSFDHGHGYAKVGLTLLFGSLNN